ncbi:MAG: AAC(3) family N-acetyltransferase [Oscillospiraceae bacterium]|nr:AAC(3) family N-acetyltransferase [Oscillospiraceae bacterium]
MAISITHEDLEKGFMRLGIKSGMMLEVHCSLSSFGHVEGGAAAVIGALKNAVGINGAIVMPSFKDSPDLPLNETDKSLGLTLKIKLLKGDEERSGMGIVSDTFRKMPDVVTGAGQFRVSAWGKDAEKHAANWFNYLINSGGYALLLGVDIYKMSSMHYVESSLPNEIKNLFKPSEEARKIYPESEWFIEAWVPSAKPWYTIQERAYEKGYITDTIIGNSKCMLVDVQPVIELYRQALQANPFELYGLKS